MPLALRLSEGLGPTLAHPPLPKPAAWNCYWKGDNDSTSWDQWHDASDPMPEQWEGGDEPDEVVPYFTGTQVLEYAGQCVRQATAECSEHWKAKMDALLQTHCGLDLETLEYLETMRQGPMPEEWAALDANARGDGEPGCRDCADNNGTCPHDGHKCGA